MTDAPTPGTTVGLWTPGLGAWPDAQGFQFQVWAAGPARVDLVIGHEGRRITLDPAGDGTFTAAVAGLAPGARYGYVLDDGTPLPDPASRCQPDGVHALSATVDPRRFKWSDDGWRGVSIDRAVFYELHVGTFTPAGTFAGVTERLPYLADLGITVVELMPVADFPGQRNWGYDGVSLFAPARCYGTPDDLRQLVDTAHRLGLAVVLDVVYNHFGPDGAYGFTFSPCYASSRHTSPWGAAMNFDGDHAAFVRAFVIENALHWLHEYHMDGLRLDATHAVVDDSRTHIVAELAARARASLPHRDLLLIAEDERNLATIVRPPAAGGWGLTAVWADDFHHLSRRITAGDRDGYYQDYSDDVRDLATTLARGWFYTGQRSAYSGKPRGTDPAGTTPEHMVICLQNHDQIGNRAFGERLHHQIDAAVFRALTTLLLCSKETPLLFMGQEWAASTPFLFFTDHNAELGRLVTAGRRGEFSKFTAFQDEATRSHIPDPQAASTFDDSHLNWAELAQPSHAAMFAFYRSLLSLRRSDVVFQNQAPCEVTAPDANTIVLRRPGPVGEMLVIARLRGPGALDVSRWVRPSERTHWSVLLTSEDSAFLPPPDQPGSAGPLIDLTTTAPMVRFLRPSAVILRRL